jgi:hypothetical protein
MRVCNQAKVRAIKATVGVNIVGCYSKFTAMEKYRIIEAGPTITVSHPKQSRFTIQMLVW